MASHGVESRDATKHLNSSAQAHEAGWCLDCAEYVQRELDGVTWTLRASCEKGAWMWRPQAKRAISESKRVSAMSSYQLCVNEQTRSAGATYPTLDLAKAAGRIAIEPTAEEEEAPGSFIDLDSFFVVHKITSANGSDDPAIYDSRRPT